MNRYARDILFLLFDLNRHTIGGKKLSFKLWIASRMEIFISIFSTQIFVFDMLDLWNSFCLQICSLKKKGHFRGDYGCGWTLLKFHNILHNLHAQRRDSCERRIVVECEKYTSLKILIFTSFESFRISIQKHHNFFP